VLIPNLTPVELKINSQLMVFYTRLSVIIFPISEKVHSNGLFDERRMVIVRCKTRKDKVVQESLFCFNTNKSLTSENTRSVWSIFFSQIVNFPFPMKYCCLNSLK
jgi:hypothetical protein